MSLSLLFFSFYLFLSPSPFDFVWELSVHILCPFRGCTLHVLSWLFCVIYHLQYNASSLIDLFRLKTDSERSLFRCSYLLAPILATLSNANAEYMPLDTGFFRWIGKKCQLSVHSVQASTLRISTLLKLKKHFCFVVISPSFCSLWGLVTRGFKVSCSQIFHIRVSCSSCFENHYEYKS